MREVFNYLIVKLAVNDSDPFNKSLDSIYFSRAPRLCNLRFVTQISDEATKNESLGHLWNSIKPSRDGYLFEIAAELPYSLPSFDGLAEYELFAGAKKYIICNRMVRAYFMDPSKPEGEPEYFLVHQLGLPSLKQYINAKKLPLSLCPVPMKCFISSKFECQEKTVEESIKNNFLSWQAELFFGISQILRAIRSTIPLESNNILPISSSASCPIIWVATEGDHKQIGCEQFAGNLGMIIHRPTATLDKAQSRNIRTLLLGEQAPDVFEDAMGLAKTFLFYGYFDLAVIEVCTACETLISMVVKKHLEKRGVSRKAIKEQYDVKYSELLNFFLPMIIDLSELKNHQELLGDLNWARKRRNELVHDGVPDVPLDKGMLQKVIQSAARLTDYIKRSESKKHDVSSIPPTLTPIEYRRPIRTQKARR